MTQELVKLWGDIYCLNKAIYTDLVRQIIYSIEDEVTASFMVEIIYR